MALKGALRLHFRRRVFDAKTKVGEREDPSNKNESPEAIESSRKTTFEFRRASADDVMRISLPVEMHLRTYISHTFWTISIEEEVVFYVLSTS